MLNKNTGKAFHGTKWRAVYNHRTVTFIISPHIGEVESLRHHIVYLHSTQLPFSANGIPNNKVNLRPVNTSFTLSDGVLQSHLVSSFLVFEISTIPRSEEHTSELQSRGHLVCRLL